LILILSFAAPSFSIFSILFFVLFIDSRNQ